MNIKDIVKELGATTNVKADVEVKGVSHDSRRIKPGELFVALIGTQANGEQYALDAIKNGAIAIVAEHMIPNMPCIVVPNARRAIALLAAMFTDYAHRRLKLVAVVGTNGKTTTASLVYNILKKTGKKSCLIGTLGSLVNDVEIDTNLTTPDPMELHNVMAYAVDNDCEYCVMEVSAHAIFFEKIYGLSFSTAIFTNLSQDHLDFFCDMTAYEDCKKSFFRDYSIGVAIVNGDDKLGREILNMGLLNAISYGIDTPTDAFAIDCVTREQVKYTANICDKIGVVSTQLHGKFNVYNTLSALTAVTAMGVELESAIAVLSTISPILGRYNVINGRKKVIIDYAHTPDGLENILNAVREDASGRVISVFGCGGNRDPHKRKIMGNISGRLSDVTIVTTDNSRLEDPYVIMDEIVAGVAESDGKYQIIRNREDAIAFALMCARDGDVVVVAGKGAEQYMDEGGVKTPYSDYDTVDKLLRRGDF